MCNAHRTPPTDANHPSAHPAPVSSLDFHHFPDYERARAAQSFARVDGMLRAFREEQRAAQRIADDALAEVIRAHRENAGRDEVPTE